MSKGILPVFAILMIPIIWGCAGMKTGAPPPSAPHVLKSRILDLREGSEISFDDLTQSLSAKDLVFVGEVHDSPAHHLIETQILEALLHRWGQDASVGMEFFPRPSQEILDRYIRGELTEAEFLDAVDWERIWGYDYYLYRPLMLAAKARGVRVLALNAPSPIVKKVAREGLGSLTEHERAQIAREIDLGNKDYREFLQKAFGEHGHAGLSEFEYFLEAQAVWDETMAETISDHIREKGGKMVVFSGNGHILYKFGVPERTARRVSVSMATVVPYPAGGKEEFESGLADYVWLTPGHPRLRQ